jgi:hypothetical protein
MRVETAAVAETLALVSCARCVFAIVQRFAVLVTARAVMCTFMYAHLSIPNTNTAYYHLSLHTVLCACTHCSPPPRDSPRDPRDRGDLRSPTGSGPGSRDEWSRDSRDMRDSGRGDSRGGMQQQRSPQHMMHHQQQQQPRGFDRPQIAVYPGCEVRHQC